MYKHFLNRIEHTAYNIINLLVSDFIDTYINDINALRELKIILDNKTNLYNEFDKGTLYFSKLFLENRITNLDFEHKLRVQRTNINIGFAGL